jgi:probable phosphoglycerate mutase
VPEARRLILLRHGQTEWNLLGRAQGHADIALDEVGRSQAETVAPYVAAYGPTRLWSSDLSRARETAAYVASDTGLSVETSSAFREYSVGERTGMTLAEFAEAFPAQYAAWRAGDRDAVPGAETDADVLDRFLPALESALAGLPVGECGVLVSHGAVLKTALVRLLGLGPDAYDRLVGLGNCHWVELEESPSALSVGSFTGGDVRWRLRGYNLSAPAPGDLGENTTD